MESTRKLACVEVRGHQAVSHGDEEEFVVAAKHGVPSPGGGDLGFGAGSKWHNVDFGLPVS
jgi:hypothetical protein